MRKSLGLNRERKGDLHDSVTETSLHALGTQTTRSFAGRDTGQSSRASLTTQDIFLKQVFNFQDVFHHKRASTVNCYKPSVDAQEYDFTSKIKIKINGTSSNC